ncbi:hypothetical protein [Acidipila rosea]|uniref:Uncharacterized protein n=1 Tax=Acidipila rosea TaxID=768535 RepID=A0A4R1L5Q5_9BACT|nr:hypothetical protein [Acidipila rosea]TCK71599.1 hypothetical protein C7378_2879 [Acidipila rosea]
MFDVTGQDISLLSDEDLRTLVGRLCEAELRRLGLSPLCATWGGNQNAVDGGVDVRVTLGESAPLGAAFARPNAVYQVKAEDMPRGKILAEMKPDGTVRPSILELAAAGGSYIIVSSKGSASDFALADRRRAMHDAVAGIANCDDLYLDFYDRDRLATWVRDHAGIVTWVRVRIGRPISGWRPYDDWAASREGLAGTYLIDDSLRIRGVGSRGEGESIVQGMGRLRRTLAAERGVVRLVGLSGVGKTRLVQALFDDRVGQFALSADLAIYTNLSDNPSPKPIPVSTELVALGRRQVLIVDNCTPDLHRRLAEVCTRTESRVSLLTVEYDVREDQPEDTDVFELQPSSDDLIEKLLQRRVTGLSQVNARSIATFASGNARVALALAHTVDSHESVALLNDAELFERLFRQRNESSGSLLVSAQACSLAYSFQGEDLGTGVEAELSKLAAVVGRDARTLYADVAELKRRDLVQQRGAWRALLPHAIANRLAAMALENISSQDFDQLVVGASDRLLKSISRRLGYLHTSPAAQSIVRRWFAVDGLLGRVEELNETRRTVLNNVAPVNPAGAIDTIERAMLRARQAGEILAGEEFRTLLLSLAFEADLFDRSVALILDLIESEEPGRYANQVRNSFPSLFHAFLSGTHATIEQRCRVVDGLLKSNSEVRRELGFKSLEAMLQTSGFSSFHRFDFGGRSRDYGWHPKRRQDVVHWFQSVLALCSSHDVRNDANSSRVRTILGTHLRNLWTEAELQDEVEAICREFQERRFWPEGWTGIRSIRRWREEPLPAEEDTKLARIEATLSPQTLVEQVRARVLRNVREAYDDIGFRDYQPQHERHQQQLMELGRTLSAEGTLLDGLIGELIICSTSITLEPLAKGLVDATTDQRALWDKLVASFRAADPAQRSPELLACYIFNLQSANSELAEELLDQCLNDSLLAEWFPYFQKGVVISAAGLQRLKDSLAQKSAPAERYMGLAWNNKLDDSATLELLPLILQLDGGFDVAVDTLHMRILQVRQDKQALSPELIAAGRIVIDACKFDRRLKHDAHALGEVIEVCMSSADAIPMVEMLLARLRESHANYTFDFMEENQILGALFAAQPTVVLDDLFAPGRQNERTGFRDFFDHDDVLCSPLDRIPETTLLAWCDEDRTARYPRIAARMVPFSKAPNSDKPQWKPSALALLERAPNKIDVLTHYIRHFEPMSWSGSRSATWEANARLLDHFENDSDTDLAAFARLQRDELIRSLDALKRQELDSEKRENERFE